MPVRSHIQPRLQPRRLKPARDVSPSPSIRARGSPFMQRTTLLVGLVLSFLGVLPLFAQTPATGVITGRVFNPNTGQYLRNAQVRIEETGRSAISESGGEFRISGVPA